MNHALYIVAVTRLQRDPATTRIHVPSASPKARPNEKSSAASSDTSHDVSGASSNTSRPQNQPLDKHRSVAREGPR